MNCRRWNIAGPSLMALMLLASPALAAPTQQEVLRSINENVGAEIDPNKLLAFVIAVLSLIAIVVALSYRQKRTVLPKVLNHPGKLTREIAKAIDLKPSELKQLKLRADERQLSSPLLLLLCPSLLAPSAQKTAEPAAASSAASDSKQKA